MVANLEMNAFPIIETIDDVLPHIAGHEDSFFVKQTDFGCIVNYHSIVNAFGDMWTTSETGDVILNYSESVRRECRGLKFDETGRILSRPFQKFFNVDEKKETKLDALPWHHGVSSADKMDGSMLTITKASGKMRFMTKMGVTDTAIRFEEEFKRLAGENYEHFLDLVDSLQQHGATMIFEGVAPWNRIVVGYERAELVLLAVRMNVTGRYLDIHDFFGENMMSFVSKNFNIPIRHVDHERHDGMNDAVERLGAIKNSSGEEGRVFIFGNGVRAKSKTDWYRSLHASRDDFSSSPRRRLELALQGRLDDVLPILSEAEKEDAIRLSKMTSHAIHVWSGLIDDAVRDHVDHDQKTFALSEELKSLAEISPILKAVAFQSRNTPRESSRKCLVESLIRGCADAKRAGEIEFAMLNQC